MSHDNQPLICLRDTEVVGDQIKLCISRSKVMLALRIASMQPQTAAIRQLSALIETALLEQAQGLAP